MLLKEIEYFQAVVEEKNFYKASEKCHISQSAISQQIKKLEIELGVKLLDRHNRTFSLTKEGELFYEKSLNITNDLNNLINEIKNKHNTLNLGYYDGYHGNEFENAIKIFSQKNPNVVVNVKSGSHEQLYEDVESGKLDLILNDQRRAFSSSYNNLILSTSIIYVDVSANNKLSKLNKIEINDLKDIPCILVSNGDTSEEEKQYYKKIVGIKSEIIFVKSIQEGRLKIISAQGYMPIDVLGKQEWFDTSIKRIPLVRNGEAISKSYCAFSKKENNNPYINNFTDLLIKEF